MNHFEGTLRPICARAIGIDELQYNLDNICTDDKKHVNDYSDAEIVSEAAYVLDLFVNPAQGHINRDALCGMEGPEQRVWARSQVGKLERFIKRYRAPAPVLLSA